MAMNVGKLVIKGAASVNVAPSTENKEVVQAEEGTIVHNGKTKKFNKKMSAYMIDMLTSED